MKKVYLQSNLLSYKDITSPVLDQNGEKGFDGRLLADLCGGLYIPVSEGFKDKRIFFFNSKAYDLSLFPTHKSRFFADKLDFFQRMHINSFYSIDFSLPLMEAIKCDYSYSKYFEVFTGLEESIFVQIGSYEGFMDLLNDRDFFIDWYRNGPQEIEFVDEYDYERTGDNTIRKKVPVDLV